MTKSDKVKRRLRRKARDLRANWELYYVRTRESLPSRFKYYARNVQNGFTTLNSAEEWAKALDPIGNYIRVRKRRP